MRVLGILIVLLCAIEGMRWGSISFPSSHAQEVPLPSESTITSTSESQPPPPFVPSHESAIVLIHNSEDTLYSLDENGLLNIGHLESSIPLRYKIIRTTGRILSAKFFYPFIAFVENDGHLRVHDIEQNFEVFSTSQYEITNTSYSFSPSGKFFAYFAQKNIHILSSESWRMRAVHPHTGVPQFITISNSDSVILLYDQDGMISYKNIESGTIIRKIRANVSPSSLLTNTTRRFAAGIVGHQLVTVDLVNGTTVENLTFAQSLNSIHQQKSSNTIIVVTSSEKTTYELRFFTFQNDGTLREDDTRRLSRLHDVGTLSVTENALYIGTSDGKLFSYDLFSKHLVPVAVDETIANYDSLIVNDTLLLLNADGIRSVSLRDALSSSKGRFPVDFSAQRMSAPFFVRNRSQDVSIAPRFGVLSRNAPGSVFFPISVDDDEERQKITAHIGTPRPFSPIPTTILAYENLILTYAERATTTKLYRFVPDSENLKISPSFRVRGSSFSPVFDLTRGTEGQSIIVTNALLHTDREKTYDTRLRVYDVPQQFNSLRLLKNIQLPFETNSVHYIRHLDENILLLVRGVEDFFVYLAVYTDKQGETRVSQLGRTPYFSHAHFFLQKSTTDNAFTLISSDKEGIYALNIRLETVKTESLVSTNASLIRTSFTPLPNTFSSPISMHLNDRYISAVDRNNLCLIAEITSLGVEMRSLVMLKHDQSTEPFLIVHAL